MKHFSYLNKGTFYSRTHALGIETTVQSWRVGRSHHQEQGRKQQSTCFFEAQEGLRGMAETTDSDIYEIHNSTDIHLETKLGLLCEEKLRELS